METVLAAVLPALVLTIVPGLIAWRAQVHAKTAVKTAAGVATVAADAAAIGVETRDIVRGNGHGTVTALGERIEATLVSLDAKVDAALAWQGHHAAEHTRTLAAANAAAVAANATSDLLTTLAPRTT